MPLIIRGIDVGWTARLVRSYLVASTVVLLLLTPAFSADKAKDEDTIKNANLVLQNMLDTNSVSPAVMAKANCVLILPSVKKVGIGVGGTGGRGPLACRGGDSFDGNWSAPAMFTIGGASVGLQIGGSSSDIVPLLMNPKVVKQVLTGKTKMGTDATAAAGPGATAAGATDADIYTYAKAKGAFAGVSLGGATVEPDNDANHRLYGQTVTATDIVRGNSVKPEGEGQTLVTVLDKRLMKHHK
jgi:lipid-binding SYLF domain-containing protein